MARAPATLAARLLAVAGASSLLFACSQPEPVMEVSEDDVLLAFADDGMDPEVAECLVGLASREFGVEVLAPGAATDSEQLLIDEMLLNCRDAVAILNTEERGPIDAEVRGPFNVGDDAVLDALWFDCDGGDGAACDQLWEEAPIGSIYESFGVTCGNRPEILDCTLEMNGPPGSETIGDGLGR